MSDWQDEPCEICGRMVMDELACPDRIMDGQGMCVDCCGSSGMDCPIGHHKFYHPDEWLLEIYSAYPPGSDSELGPKGKRSPDNEMVLQTLTYYQNDLRAHFQSLPTSVRLEDLPDDRIIPTYLETKMPFWREGSMDTTPPDPYPIVINRRAI